MKTTGETSTVGAPHIVLAADKDAKEEVVVFQMDNLYGNLLSTNAFFSLAAVGIAHRTYLSSSVPCPRVGLQLARTASALAIPFVVQYIVVILQLEEGE